MKMLKWLLLSMLWTATLTLAAQERSTDWKVLFKNPPNQFRPMPFWHLNGDLSTDEIVRQMNAAQKQSGFGGVTVLPVTAGSQHPTGLPCPGMKPEFMSDAYFMRYTDVLETAKKLDMQVMAVRCTPDSG